MAPHLYRLGRWSFRNRWKVLAAWLLTLVAVMAASAAFSGQENNLFVVPGTESQDAQDLLDEKFPERRARPHGSCSRLPRARS